MENQDHSTQLELLAKEYELCQAAALSFEALIWQSGAVFIGLSLGGVLLLVPLSTQAAPMYLTALLVISISSIALIGLWFRIVQRLWGMQDVAIHRMAELEQMLGFRRITYQLYRDRASTAIDPKIKASLDSAMASMASTFPRFRMKTYVASIVKILIAAWLLFVIASLLDRLGVLASFHLS